MAQALGQLSEAIDKAKLGAHDAKVKAESKMMNIPYHDIQIQFIGASGLPKMDVVGSADPYFVAEVDGKLSFVSSVKSNTLKPVWNELWRIKNVPSTATLSVKVMDKDEGPTDDYIGKFNTSITAGAKEVEIESLLLKRTKGTFWLKIESVPTAEADPAKFPYSFAGPIRYSQHKSPTVGHFTNINKERLYSTWKMYIMGIARFFGDTTQHWNREYKAAQDIFTGPRALAVRSAIQSGHRLLYARSTTNAFGTLEGPQDVMRLLHGVPEHRVKPAVYTYIISAQDDSFRFSETGAAFFVDFASKHALHANCAERVRYSGEFHPRPAGGWGAFSDATRDEDAQWELVIDNNSGTYAPDPKLLPNLQALLAWNFPGFKILALARDDPELEASVKACREYALRVRGVSEAELQPHEQEGVETLSHMSSVRRPSEESERP